MFERRTLSRMTRVSATCATLGLCFAPAAGQQPIPLRDGQQVTLHGTLTLEPAGRLQFVTVRTRETYLPVVKAEDGKSDVNAEPTHEISLSSYPRYGVVYAHRGQAVTVAGKMMTDNVTPYFFHATRLELQSMKLDDGTDLLLHKAANSQLVKTLRSYRSSVILPADLAAPWHYRANGKAGLGRAIPLLQQQRWWGRGELLLRSGLPCGACVFLDAWHHRPDFHQHANGTVRRGR